MIISIDSEASSEARAQLMNLLCRITRNQYPITSIEIHNREVIALDAHMIDVQDEHVLRAQEAVADIHTFKTQYQLVSKHFHNESVSITIGNVHGGEEVEIGGDNSPVIMAGPCAVEDWEQLISTAEAVKGAGARVLRGGAFKPRTSPYQFQGLGIEGLHLLAQAREITGLPVITEVMEPEMVEAVAEYADVLQIGTRNAQNYPLLLKAARNSKKLPVLLKRGMAMTIDEWLLAAEYIVSAGNPNVILCERGIRSYDPLTRNVLDLTCIPLLHQLTHLPIVVDPSHSTGRRELVPTMSRAAIAAEADGLIIESHPDPDKALCDGKQSVRPETLQKIVNEALMISAMVREDDAVTA